jgi:hypothetical protein
MPVPLSSFFRQAAEYMAAWDPCVGREGILGRREGMKGSLYWKGG